jgi:hypothetical protein
MEILTTMLLSVPGLEAPTLHVKHGTTANLEVTYSLLSTLMLAEVEER